MNPLWRLFAAALLIVSATAALAHEGSTSYLAAVEQKDGLKGRLDVALVDLALSLPLDGDSDGHLTWNEILAGRTRIATFLGNGLEFSRGDERCAAELGEPWLTEHLGLTYVSVDVAARCRDSGPLRITASLLFDRDNSHRLLVSLKSGPESHLATLAPGSREWSELARTSGWNTALDFVRQGMWHVWIGYDHLLFLLLLLLPAVVRREGGSADRNRGIAFDLVRIVTVFTVAHSITLGLAATAILRLPQQPIEVAIAVSIVMAAVLNLAPRLLRFRLPLAFGFGLVHGFGFANALAGLGVDGAGTLPVLAGFNVGVELANLAVIAAVLPFLLRAGRYAWYEPRALRGLSLAAAAVGALWAVQRL